MTTMVSNKRMPVRTHKSKRWKNVFLTIISMLAILVIAVSNIWIINLPDLNKNDNTTYKLVIIHLAPHLVSIKYDLMKGYAAATTGAYGFNVIWTVNPNGGCDYKGMVRWNNIFIDLPLLHSEDECNPEDAYINTAHLLDLALQKISEITHSTAAYSLIEAIGEEILTALESHIP